MGWTSNPARGAAAIGVAGVLLSQGCDYAQTSERSFVTLAEAEIAGAVTTGHVPEFLPRSARDIRTRHRQRTGDGWGRFEFDGADRVALGSACRASDHGTLRLPGSETRGTGWWAEMLRSDPASAAEQFDLFECGTAPGGTARRFLAVHRRLDTAFFWTVVTR